MEHGIITALISTSSSVCFYCVTSFHVCKLLNSSVETKQQYKECWIRYGTCPSINSNQKTLFCLVRELFQGRLLLLLRNSIVSCSFYVATAKLPAVTSKREWNGTCRKKKKKRAQTSSNKVGGEGFGGRERERVSNCSLFSPTRAVVNQRLSWTFCPFQKTCVGCVCVCVWER